jgi:hypothetical protein
MPEARFKQPSEGRQKLLYDLEVGAFKQIKEDYEAKRITDLLIFDCFPNGDKNTTLLTHHPTDLLAYYNFPDLRLVESHTGKVKTRKDWYTKLNLPKGTVCIPFTKATLSLFGDGSYILGQDIKVRKVLIKIGEKYKWNTLTTHSRMLTDIKLEYEPHLYEFIKNAGR